MDAVGSYSVTYNATDASGNDAVEVTRTVNVVDTTAPVITLNGANPQAIEQGSSYVELGATTDDGSMVVIDASAVNTNMAGSYTVTYNATDASGNSAVEVTRTVNVADTTVPVIVLNGLPIVVAEAANPYVDAGAIATDAVDGSLTASIVVVNPVNVLIPGTYLVTYNVSDAAGNAAAQVTRTVIVQDSTVPVITLLGSPTVTVEAGSSYTDAGATASDTLDGDITADIVVVNPVNTSVLGTYTVTYNVEDASSNSAVEVTRTVNVVDTTAPVITLNGANPQTIELGAGYTELGATTDDGSAVVIDASAFVDAVGSYTITYNAADASGNNAVEVSRTVNVVDTTAPVITLNGSNPQIIAEGGMYTELGATTDDGSMVVIDASAVNTNAVGSYIVTYNATDASGNAAAQVTRTVNVVDTNAPIITLNGANPQAIELGASYVELGATADDGSTVVIDASAVNTNVLGSYNVTYNATDAAGNAAVEVVRIVNVVDTTAPVITLNGANPQTIELGAGYSELGATTNDGSMVVIDASAVNTNAVGSYSVTYNATDASGNAAAQVIRTVNVVDTTAPVITLNGSNPQIIAQGDVYAELGATTDDGSMVVIDASAVNTNAIGSYSVRYNATDASGNVAVEVVRTVNVVDTNAPIITLSGANPQIIELGTAYVELGATTNDGSMVVIDASAVNTNAVGSYSVTYNATDASGNAAVEVIRTVNVVDTNAPVITLTGANPQTIELGTAYVELGATTNDGSMVVIDASAVNTNAVGSYSVTYNATDASGNNAVEVIRTVNVVDTTAPVITLNGANPQEILEGTAYVELGATTDDGSMVVIDASAVDTNVIGSYTVTYNATDASGNAAVEVTRTVNVTATLSVDENELASIRLYPNPVIDRFVVSGVSETIDMIEIYSMEGRLVKQIKDYNAQAIEVSQFQEGVYLVRISKGNSAKTIRFVKKK
nr:immunoglobulin-like domain-containing protein [Aquimarina litoralis]